MLYIYEKKEINASEKLLEENNILRSLRVEFDSFVKTPYPESNTVIAYLYEPKEIKAKTILVFLHGMGERNLIPLSWFPKKFAEKGIVSYLLILPYHFERTPKGMKSGKKFLIDDLNDTLRDFEHAVIDTRTSMDYLEGKYKSSDFAIMGFSFGGIIGTIAMGVDERIKKGIFVVTGGNFLYTTWGSPATKSLREKYFVESNYQVYGCNKKKCAEIHRDYEEYLKNIRKPEDVESVRFPKDCYLFDPLTFAPLVKGRKVIFYTAIFDEIIPRQASDLLWRWMGKPERHFMFSDHFTSILYRREILKRGVELIAGKRN